MTMKQDTFTRLPNDLLESLYQMQLSGSDFRVALFIIRYTYGFHRPEATLTVPFIMQGTGLSERSVKRSIALLNSCGIFARKGAKIGTLGVPDSPEKGARFGTQERKKERNILKKEEESDDISEDYQSIDESTSNKHTGYRF